ncbi:MAG: LLM class flavin-dependent oxidoreductase [Verrucomicrobia bacterium]|nr:LLM class flavin-dependent oxidoreductase [Verrucomicrobiota bacterium]
MAVVAEPAGGLGSDPIREPIAIVGISGRFPGASNVAEFWANLAAGKHSIREVPAERWQLDGFFAPDRGIPGRSYCKWGGFMSGIDQFDPLFFNISPHEAHLMEPQHRLFLMEAWKALEDAGYSDRELDNCRCGVFAGCAEGDYGHLLRAANRDQEAYAFLGTSQAILASRLSYWLNLKGPTLAIDTACSSSGVAIHIACESLRLRTSDLALAGGVAVLNTPRFHVLSSQTGMLSAQGKCGAFGADADGFVPGEAVAVLVLKRFTDAVRDGDHVYGVIRGSAINQDGKTNGITSPSGPSQEALEMEVYDRFGIHPESISYVECHGTGTKLGDPIEIGALTAAFRRLTDKCGFCSVGSVKTNIGHTLMASAAAGVIKVLLGFKHGQLPPTLHAEQTNPEIDFASSPFYVNCELRPWVRTAGRPRRAALSSFGFSGTNVHMILEEAPPLAPACSEPKHAYLVTLSARTDDALRRRLRELAEWLDDGGKEHPLEDISFTLNFGRSHFEKRLALIVSSTRALRNDLEKLLADEPRDSAFFGTAGRVTAAEAAIYRQVQRTVCEGLSVAKSGPDDEYREKLSALAGLYVKGFGLDWRALHRGESCRRLSMPCYPFALESYGVHRQLANATGTAEPVTAPAGPAGSREQPYVPAAGEAEYFGLQSIWQPVPLLSAETARLSGNIVVFDEDDRLVRHLAGRFPSARAVQVIPASQYSESGHLITIRPDHEEDYARLITRTPPQAVVYRWGVRDGAIGERLSLGLEAVHFLVKSLLQTSPASDIRFVLAHGWDAPPEVAALSAFLQTAAEENPKILARTVVADDPDEGVLADEVIAANDGVREVRYRDGVREVRGFRALPWPDQGAGWFRPKGVYLIVGGAGGLGRIFSAHLARSYQARLVWMGRSELTPAHQAEIDSLAAQGAEVLYVRGDVARREDATEAVRQAKRRFGRIDGVIHAAGSVRNSFLLKKRVEELREVIAAKVHGTLNLDEAIGAEPLDGFLLCSSIAAVAPEPGQADYAFANRFLDEFARVREAFCRRGLRSGKTLAINWQMWHEAGIFAGRSAEELQAQAAQTLALTGLPALTATQGLHILERSRGISVCSGLLCYGDRRVLGQRVQGARRGNPPEDAPSPASFDPPALYAKTEAYVKALIADLLELPLDRLKVDTPFSEYGLDSILITKFNGRIAKDLPSASKTLLFEYPNVAALSCHLAETHARELTALFHSEGSAPTGLIPEPASATPAAVVIAETVAVRDRVPERIDCNAPAGIAIIGIAGRYPGAPDVAAFWARLKDGADCIREVPPGRWEGTDLFDPDPAKASQGRIYCKWGGFIDGVDEFDPEFFGISPAEAEMIDPQERLFLQTAWHALEDAGYAQSPLFSKLRKRQGAGAGVFAGVTHNSYQLLGVLRNERQLTRVDHSGAWSLANRVSYFFNFCGPSLPIDTACSASLSAIHLACESLRNGECTLAVAGGVNLHLSPSKIASACALGMLSPTGCCRSFGANADGYVPGEGVGAVVLKPLDRAEQDGDHIYGVIKASAINHGGRTNGFTVPNPAAQADVIARALRKAGIDPRSITCIEAHGTGTELGDPVEVDGLTRAFSDLLRERNETAAAKPWCALGSVKSNIGHLEAAAGVAGLTKVLLQMRHRQLVPSLHAETVNPNIDFARTPFVLQRSLSEWAQPVVNGRKRPRRAGISSFGAGGSNAHLIVEEYDASARAPVDRLPPREQFEVIVLSARREAALKETAVNLLNHLQTNNGSVNEGDLRSIACTLQVAREPMKERAAFVVATLAELRDRLERFVTTNTSGDGIYRGSDRRHASASSPNSSTGEPPLTGSIAELESVASRWVNGEIVDWHARHPAPVPRRSLLPGYPFAKKRYWYGSFTAQGAQPPVPPAKPVLGLTSPVPDAVPALSHWMQPAAHFDVRPEVGLDLVDGNIAVVRMQDREHRNMFTSALVGGLMARFAEIERSETIKAVIVTGYDNVFSMGGTRDELLTLADQEITFADLEFIFKGLLQCRVPVIAAIQGHASGGGLVFGLYADVIVMAEEALCSAAFTKYGFTPGLGATFILREKLGETLATEMMLTAGTYRGADLMRRGAGAVFRPQAELFAQALAIARAIAEKPAYTLRTLKDGLARRKLQQLPAILADELRMHRETFGNPEVKRRVHAFIRETGPAVPPASPPGRSAPASNATPTGRVRLKTLAPASADAAPAEINVVPEITRPAPEPLGPDQLQMLATPVDDSVRDEVRRYLAASLCETLHLELRALDSRASFRELGLDSVSGVEFIHGVNRTFGLHLDASIVYDFVHLDALSDHVAGLVAKNRAIAFPSDGGTSTGKPAEPRPAPPPENQRSIGSEQGAPPASEPPLAAGVAGPRLDGADTGWLQPDPKVTPRLPTAYAPQIAVIGVSCRLPGAPDLDAFWRNLATGSDSITEVPRERWDVEKFFDPNPNAEGRTYCKWGGFIEDVDKFDPLFFSLSHAEAEVMDPQQRIFLQEAWKAFENAGYAAGSLSEARCGVFVGASVGDYGLILRRENPALSQSAYAGMGLTSSMLAARISYLLNLKGPSISIDTACSSSLVALHQACRSIQAGDCDMALAGGINLILDPDQMIRTSKLQMLSPNGRCRPFDHRADGIALSEGVAVVILKPLDKAIADGDPIHGVIKASGINQDGKTNGITAPSATAQTRLALEVYRQAGVHPDQIEMVEAHGTGTLLGDPVEVRGLTEAFRTFTGRTQFCALGSVKSNIGHTSFAAGLAGVLKVLLCFKHGQIPPSLHFEKPNEHIDFDRSPFFVNTQLRSWERRPGHPRLAAVSSFGYSGTNAHVVLADYHGPPPLPDRISTHQRYPIVLSAKTDEALRQRAVDLRNYLGRTREGLPGPEQEPVVTNDIALPELAYTLQVGRDHMEERLAIIASDPADLHEKLGAFLNDERPVGGLYRGTVRPLTGRSGAPAAPQPVWPEDAAQAWVDGTNIDWSAFYGPTPSRRIPLPAYPFGRERCWIQPAAPRALPAVGGGGPHLHPLLHRNTSTVDGLRFTTELTPESSLLRDHQVREQRVLPGAAILEMAVAGVRAAAGCAAIHIQLEEVVWLRPLVVDDRCEAHLLLRPHGDEIEFAVVSQDKVRIVHAQGRARTGVEFRPGTVDLSAVRDRCPQQLSPAALYDRLACAGLKYGESFRTVSEICYGDGEALSRLRCSAVGAPPAPEFTLPPNLLDGAFQTVAVLAAQPSGAVPFSLGRLRFTQIGCARFAYVERTLSGRELAKFRVAILDEQGSELLVIDDFTVKSIVPVQGTVRFVRPRWERRPLPAQAGAALRGTMLLFDDEEPFAAHIRKSCPELNVVRVCPGTVYQASDAAVTIRPRGEADFRRLLEEVTPDCIVHRWSRPDLEGEACLERAFGSMFSLTRALVRREMIRDLPLLYVWPSTAQPAYEAMHAYARTLLREQPKLRIKTVTGADPDALLQELACTDVEDVEIRWSEDSTRMVRTTEAFAPDSSGAFGLRDRGVYLISGGTGALGMVFAEYLARRFRARLVLLSRSALTDPVAARFRAWEGCGAEVLHVQGDVARRDDVARCFLQAKQRFGVLNGVIHAAGILRDALLWNKELEDALAVLRPKVLGARWLDEITADEPLDFFVLFSSLAGLFGNVGQADYAYANAFLDAFARTRATLELQQLRRGRTVSINWPLWHDGGMQLPAELARLKMRELVPLDSATGIRIFETVLRAGAPQIGAMLIADERPGSNGEEKGGTHELPRRSLDSSVQWSSQVRAAGIDQGSRQREAASDRSAGSVPASAAVDRTDVTSLLKQRFSQLTKIPVGRIQGSEALEKYGIDSILVMTFTQRLEEDFGPLSKTLLFEYQTLETLAGYFIAHHSERLEAMLGRGSGRLPAAARVPDAGATPAPAASNRHAETRRDAEEVAIVGLFGRFPMANNPDEFWRNLVEGRDCIVEVPAKRWDYRRYFDAQPGNPGKTYNKWGGFIDDVDKFDAAFFRIPPREAETMDPQERLFLETVWRTVEDAGYCKSALRQKRVGVFVGVMYGQYQLLALENSPPGRLVPISSSYASIANRVSYFFDWSGPSMAVDSMCSSSLTAIHLACDSLRKGESDCAIAGGVNLLLHPVRDVGLAQGGFAATDGRCKSFGAGGDGYVPGEGVGAVFLKTLSRAIADNDHIYAVIKASSVNHGGKTNGYTVPNPKAQAALIADTLRTAGIDPRTITYLEAHGTGTSLGDPIEITGLAQAFLTLEAERDPAPAKRDDRPKHACAIGSAKSNIGHLEGAAGIAGLTKVLLQLQHRTLVPSLHSRALNPHIRFEETPFVVQQELSAWHPARFENGRGSEALNPRRAGISSFGAGGSNAHLIVEEFLDPRPSALDGQEAPVLILLSAANADRLAALAGNLLAWFSRLGSDNAVRQPTLAEIAYTLQTGREPLEERVAFVVASPSELQERLALLAAGDAGAEFVRGNIRRDRGASAAVVEGAEGQAFLRNLIDNRNLTKLATLWVNGVEIDWGALWSGQEVRRASLPGYPFSPERCWLPISPRPDESNRFGVPRLHPLLHRNESSLRGQAYGSDFTGDEVVLRDHRINGQAVFPGAASLELALTGASFALEDPNVRLQHVVWTGPVVASERGVALKAELRPESNGRVRVELLTTNREIVVQGIALVGGTLGDDEAVDLAAIQARCSQMISPDELYAGFARHGLEYGPAFRGVQSIGFREGEVWSVVEVPEVWGSDSYRLHPALVDGAFQSLATIATGHDGIEYPFAVDAVECGPPLPKRVHAYGRLENAPGGTRRYEIKLLGERGEILARLSGLQVRPSRTNTPLFYRPVWIDEPCPESFPLAGPVLLFDEESGLDRAIAERGIQVIRVVPGPDYSRSGDRVTIRKTSTEDYVRLVREVPCAAVIHGWARQGTTLDETLECGLYSVHRLVRALLKGQKTAPLIVAYPEGEIAHEALGGYAKSLRQENPKLRLKVVGINGVSADLLAELGDDRFEVRYVAGHRQIRTLERIAGPLSGDAALRQGGVYIITGGAGGLGMVFAEHLATRYDARLVLVGRSEPGEDKRRFLARLGDQATYVRADVATPEGAGEAVRAARHLYDGLHGVVHAAGDLRDGLIWNKSDADIAAVLGPKVRGVEALDVATRQESLDCFILFSSTAGLLGNAGQSDYAYANAYLDAFARRRDALCRLGQRSGRTLSINWPLWRDGGMRAGKEAAALTSLGLLPLDRSTGIDLFEQAMASGEVQLWCGIGDRAKVEAQLLNGNLQRDRVSVSIGAGSPAPEPQQSRAFVLDRRQVVDYLIRRFAELTKLPAAQVHADEPIENYGIDSIAAAAFAQMLEDDLGALSKTLLFEYPTLEALAGYLMDNHEARLSELLQPRGGPVRREVRPESAAVGVLAASSPEPAAAPEPVAKPAVTLSEDIAVIGIAGRYPQADDLDEFWAKLAAGKDCIEEVPADRWDYRDHYDPEPGKQGKTNNKWGGFLKDVDKFDPLFFNISPLEARFMDPQERLFLEIAWKTIEDAGYSKTALSDRKIGVFAGVMYAHYQLFGVEERLNGNPISLSASFATIANRVSYFFNWHGPSLAVDTMCSASLTSVHLACESLKRGECELALAGGVNTTVHPEKDFVLSQTGFSAGNGRCKAFGQGGSGYVPGEGVGALLLKPLERARADHDHIYGVIKASSLNHGGKTNGYTVPNSRSQAEVILETLRKAKVDPATITYVETHGTGTALGDPIEIAGLQQAFTEALAQRAKDGGTEQLPLQFCAIGAVKSNIGHCESAAGIAGITKVLLQLKHRKLVPSLHTEPPNPNINFEETFFRVQRHLEDWPQLRVAGQALPRRAGVSSFGAGGANAHLIIEEHCEPVLPVPPDLPPQPVLFVLSAKSAERVREVATKLILHLEQRRSEQAFCLRDAAYTLQAGREPLEERVALVVSSAEACVASLRGWINGATGAGVYCGNAKTSSPALEELRQAGTLQDTLASLLTHQNLERIAELWVSGAHVDWSLLYREGTPRRVVLPTYPFARERYWVPKRAFFDLTGATGSDRGTSHSQDPGTRMSSRVEMISPAVSAEVNHDRGAERFPAIGFSLMFFSDNSQVAARNKYELVLAAAKFADEHGFEAVWTPERHFHPFGGIYSSPATLTAALAVTTRRIRLRAGSVVVPLEDPVRVAEAWSVVDNLSGGRVDIACASGWNANDFALAPDVYARLREVWLERIPVIQRLWRGEAIQRRNGKGETIDLRIYPQPCQKELPVWLTASRRVETFIDAGRSGYHVLTMLQGSTLVQLKEKIARYRQARQESGWEPGSGKVTLMLHTLVHPDAAYARRLVREPFLEYIRSSLDAHKTALSGGERLGAADLNQMAEFSYERYCREASLIGDPATCFEMVRQCREAGVDEIACLVDFGADAASVVAALPHLDELRRISLDRLPPVPASNGSRVEQPPPVPTTVRGVSEAEPDGREDGEIPGRFFIGSWVESPVVPAAPRETPRTVLVICSAENLLHEALVERFAAPAIRWIKLGHQNRQPASNVRELDVEDRGALERALSQSGRPDLIYFTGGLGLSAGEGDELSRVEQAHKHGTGTFVQLVQALERLGWAGQPRQPLAIRVITAGAHQIGDEPLWPYAAGLSGFAGSLAKESPQLDVATLDVDLRDLENPSAVRQLADLIAFEPGHRSSEKVAFRRGRRFRLRLCPTEIPPAPISRFRPGGVYLIVGGAGNLGFKLSHYLATQFRAKLVWTGRRGFDAQIGNRIEQVRSAGGEVVYLQARAEDLPGMRGVLQAVARQFGALNGVIHAPLVFQDEPMRSLEEDGCREILNSKTASAAVLAELVSNLQLDFLLFLGSAQSFFNEARRAAYAGGCCFVDAYARHLQRRVGFPVHVINWGFWSHSFDKAVRSAMRAAGLGVIEDAEGMDVIERVLAAGLTQAGFLKADLEALQRMDFDLSEKSVRLPDTGPGYDQLEASLVTNLFN